MKKLLIILVMLAVVFSAFAQEADDVYYTDDQTVADTGTGKGFGLEVTAGIPVHWTDAEYNNVEDKTVSTALALGIALTYNFNRKFGLTLDTDVSFARNLYGNPSTDSVFHSLVTANVLFGPVIYLYNGSFLRIPLALGIHYYFFSVDHWDAGATNVFLKQTDHQFGPGAYIGIQFHFNKSLYILSRTNVNFDVARYYKAKTNGGSTSDFKLVGALSVKPTLGLGIKF
ncbi:MAG: hypothetical protein LBI67_02805 [Treponema sp.]|jgi:opacity protein-like surface antigen|nr:hypothetical protein [Treponema sp.]